MAPHVCQARGKNSIQMWASVLLGVGAVTALLASFPRLQRTNKVTEVLTFVLVVPWFAALIKLDSLLHLHNLPRSARDVLAHPARFFDLLKASKGSGIPADAQLVSITPAGGIEAEPAKDATAFKFRVQYSVPAGGSGTLNVFVKVQSERQVALLLKGIACAFIPEHREVGGCLHNIFWWCRRL